MNLITPNKHRPRRPVSGGFTAHIARAAWAFTVYLAGVACGDSAQAAGTERTIPGRAEVRAMTGSAVWSTNGGPVLPLKVGTVLYSGTTLITATNSTVDLFLGRSAGVVRVAEASTLSLDSLKLINTGADTKVEVQLELPDGEMYFNVNKLSKASRYEIKMPTGVAGIRGTKGNFNARPNTTKPRILLLEGTVILAHTTPSGQMVTLTMKAPPPVTFEPTEGVKEAAPAAVTVVVAQVDSATKAATPAPQAPPPKPTAPPVEPVLSPN